MGRRDGEGWTPGTRVILRTLDRQHGAAVCRYLGEVGVVERFWPRHRGPRGECLVLFASKDGDGDGGGSVRFAINPIHLGRLPAEDAAAGRVDDWPPGTRVLLRRVDGLRIPALCARLGQEGVIERRSRMGWGARAVYYLVRFGSRQGAAAADTRLCEWFAVAAYRLSWIPGVRPVGAETNIPPGTWPIPGEVGLRADRDGEIWYYTRARWQRLAREIDRRRRVRVRVLAEDGIRERRLRVAWLVLRTFVGPPPWHDVPRHHPDPNPQNCRLDNLQWAPRPPRWPTPTAYGPGTAHPNAILTEPDIPAIRQMYRDGFTAVEIAAIFEVHDFAIRRIVNGEGWTHVPDPLGPICPRGRGQPGLDNPKAQLSPELMEAIKADAERDLAVGRQPCFAELARRHGVSAAVVGAFLHGKSYADEGVSLPGLASNRGRCKLTMDDARRLRRLAAEAKAEGRFFDAAAHAKRLGMTPGPIRALLRGKTYRESSGEAGQE